MVFIFGKFLNFRPVSSPFSHFSVTFKYKKRSFFNPLPFFSIIYAQNTFFRSVFRYKRKRRLILKNDALHYPKVLLRSLYEAISKA